MGCVCCSLSSFFSVLLDALERISLCTVCAMLTCCFFFTILTVLIMGIGIGYHYCFVQTSVEAVEKAAKATTALRSGDRPERSTMMRSVDRVMRRGLSRKARSNADGSPVFNNNTLNSLHPLNYNYTLFNNTDSLFNNTELINIINSTLDNTINYTITQL
ncbi:unnamed protein product [Arctia plantaginis]|uniref:Uncharacterized protein n=1 Tax=Arctia plantaginis TaxID=874455 RepID=A0A8S0Z433_ARCPL|nr:unnamed protein product [Arctia plantaginis]